MSGTRNMQIAKEWHEVFDTERLRFIHNTYLDETFTAEIFGQELNREQYIFHDLQVAAAFQDNRVEVGEQIADEEKVVSVMTWTAVHVGELYGIPATGKPIRIKGVAIDHFKNGKVVKHYRLFNSAELLKRQTIREQVRTQMAMDLHDNIGSTLGSIAYYSEMAQQLVDKNNPALKALLQKIEETSHQLVEEMSDLIWTMNPKNDRFEHLASRMTNYAADILAARNIEFHFQAEQVPKCLPLTIEARKNIFLIFKEVVYNTLKYSGCTQFRVCIVEKNQVIIAEMSDNGIGFDLDKHRNYNGNGLPNMKQRAEEIGARLSIFSDANRGTEIRLEVPVAYLSRTDSIQPRLAV